MVGSGSEDVKTFLVFGVSSRSVRNCNGEGILIGVDKAEIEVEDARFPNLGEKGITVFLAVCVYEGEDFVPEVLESNFVKFQLNLGLRQQKSG